MTGLPLRVEVDDDGLGVHPLEVDTFRSADRRKVARVEPAEADEVGGEAVETGHPDTDARDLGRIASDAEGSHLEGPEMLGTPEETGLRLLEGDQCRENHVELRCVTALRISGSRIRRPPMVSGEDDGRRIRLATEIEAVIPRVRKTYSLFLLLQERASSRNRKNSSSRAEKVRTVLIPPRWQKSRRREKPTRGATTGSKGPKRPRFL